MTLDASIIFFDTDVLKCCIHIFNNKQQRHICNPGAQLMAPFLNYTKAQPPIMRDRLIPIWTYCMIFKCKWLNMSSFYFSFIWKWNVPLPNWMYIIFIDSNHIVIGNHKEKLNYLGSNLKSPNKFALKTGIK